jgi:hypothetical protein
MVRDGRPRADVLSVMTSRPGARLSAVLVRAASRAPLPAFDPTVDGDALAWLGFEPGDPDEPLLTWPRPQHWPAARRRAGGRHRAPARFRAA